MKEKNKSESKLETIKLNQSTSEIKNYVGAGSKLDLSNNVRLDSSNVDMGRGGILYFVKLLI
jgi:hypothetical protein